VRETGVDALAIAMGTSHGAYKFSRKPDGDILALHVVRAINARLPSLHLVMHGSSSVPQALQALFTRYGGAMAPTWGVPVEEIQEGIRHGVRKVNIDTDCRLAMAAEFRRVAAEKPGEFDPRKFLQRRHRGQAARIKPIPLADMARRYAAGSLAPSHLAITPAVTQAAA
jgi:fructose-bisphosphate aldolase class II